MVIFSLLHLLNGDHKLNSETECLFYVFYNAVAHCIVVVLWEMVVVIS